MNGYRTTERRTARTLALALLLAGAGVRAQEITSGDALPPAVAVEFEGGDARRVGIITRWADEFHRRFAGLLGRARRRPLTVVVLPDTARFRARLAADGIDRAPETAAGLAVASLDRCYLNLEAMTENFEVQVERVLGHELCHLALAEFETRGALPLWFHEGVAQWASRRPVAGDEGDVKAALAAGTLLEFADLAEQFPAGQTWTALAYAQSESFIAFLDARAPGGVARLLAAFAAGGDFPAAFAGAFGGAQGELEAAWREYLRTEGESPLAAWLRGWWWELTVLVMAAALLGARWRQRRRNRRIAAEWSAEGFGAEPDERFEPRATAPPLGPVPPADAADEDAEDDGGDEDDTDDELDDLEDRTRPWL